MKSCPESPDKPRRFEVERSQHGVALVDYLSGGMGLSKRKAKAFLDRRDVFVNGRRIWMARHPVAAGDVIEILTGGGSHTQSHQTDILFRDRYYVIANKKPDILTCGPDGLEEVLKTSLGLPKLAPVHRLDKDTSGCVIFADGVEALEKMIPLFRQRAISKQYHAIVERMVREKCRSIVSPVEGQRAVTHVRVLDANRSASHLYITIETGRTHQIRQHLISIGHPVLGDRIYGSGRELPDEYRSVPRQMLHASNVRFVHPFTGQTVNVGAPIPKDFAECLRRMGLK